MTTTAPLPLPSKAHATCAWCRADFRTITDLLAHTDEGHLQARSVPVGRGYPRAA
jgi:hypothetical protein